MCRILIAFNGTRVSSGAMAYGIELAKKMNAGLTGVFLRDMRYTGDVYNYGFGEPYIDFDQLEKDSREEEKLRRENMELFVSTCKEEELDAKVHRDNGSAARDLVYESSFADLVVISSETSFFEVYSDLPGSFLHEILVDSHCPVLIVPENHSTLQKAILTYDGSPVSLHAIKMFSYIFRDLHQMEITVLSSYKKDDHANAHENLSEFLARFKDYTLEKIREDSIDSLSAYLEKHSANSLVVMGSYGRNAISRFIHKSTADKVITDIKMPVFISHF
jgi:nucleotide-binding universal stress UspA family protein